MSLRLKYQTILTHLVPAGAVGLSLALGAASPAAASEPPAGVQPSVVEKGKVSERLAAVRDAVSALAETKTDVGKTGGRLTWYNGWWGGWGGGYYPWNNWHNWRNWGNGWFRNW